MSVRKNDRIELEIKSCTAQGDGVGHYDGLTIFVANAAVGDVVIAHLLKVKSKIAFAKVEKIIVPSQDRIEVDCPVFSKCGGCTFRHISYEQELEIKQNEVAQTMKRIGHIEIEPQPIIGAKKYNRYRNKAQYPISIENGNLKIGFFAPRSHRVVDCRDCLLQPESFENILETFDKWVTENEINIYDEIAHRGLLRHIYIRQVSGGDTLVCAVINGDSLPHTDRLIEGLTRNNPKIKGIVLNVNKHKTNVILGKKCVTIWGDGYITDKLCGLKFRISPLSFYQVNSKQTEKLYEKAAEYAALSGNETLFDIYCGIGTIGLILASKAKQVVGIEIVPDAVENAKENAKINGIENARFICSDAAKAAEQLKSEGVFADVVVVDPPRKGCSPELLNTIIEMSPDRLVYISCNPATLARDCAILDNHGYKTSHLTPVDMFPRTGHVETVVLMSRV